jgi:high-affinity iron transporter
LGTFFIVLREGFEASLVIGLMLAFLKKTGQRQHNSSVWWGVAAATAASVVMGGILFGTVGELEGTSEYLFEGIAMLIATVVLTWMVFWMRSQAATIGGHLREQVSQAIVRGGGVALASVAFIAVAREGLESVLFIFASVSDDGVVATIVGGTLGLFAAVVLGSLLYRGSLKLDLRRFFLFTSVIVIALAAYLLAGALHELGEAGAGEFFEEAGPVAALLYAGAFVVLYLRTSKPKKPEAPVSKGEVAAGAPAE